MSAQTFLGLTAMLVVAAVFAASFYVRVINPHASVELKNDLLAYAFFGVLYIMLAGILSVPLNAKLERLKQRDLDWMRADAAGPTRGARCSAN